MGRILAHDIDGLFGRRAWLAGVYLFDHLMRGFLVGRRWVAHLMRRAGEHEQQPYLLRGLLRNKHISERNPD